MAGQGRHKTPTKILELRGSWRAKQRMNEPHGIKGIPEPPEFLSDEEKTIWNYVTKILDDIGIIENVDRNMIARYAVTYNRWLKALEMSRKYEDVRLDPKTHRPMEMPHAKLMARLEHTLIMIEREFGMSPTARARLSITKNDLNKSKKSIFNVG